MKIEVVAYSKVIGKKDILNDITIEFYSGNIYCLKGINGSGKTMLLRAIAGLIKPTSGYVSIDGKKLGSEIEFPDNMGLLIENPSFIDSYSGLTNLKLLASIRNVIEEEKVRDAISLVGLDPSDKRAFKKYSLGMKQRLGIACAIMESPNLLLLDEPLNSLDTEGILLVKNILKKERDRGCLIIIASHDVDELEGVVDNEISVTNGVANAT